MYGGGAFSTPRGFRGRPLRCSGLPCARCTLACTRPRVMSPRNWGPQVPCMSRIVVDRWEGDTTSQFISRTKPAPRMRLTARKREYGLLHSRTVKRLEEYKAERFWQVSSGSKQARRVLGGQPASGRLSRMNCAVRSPHRSRHARHARLRAPVSRAISLAEVPTQACLVASKAESQRRRETPAVAPVKITVPVRAAHQPRCLTPGDEARKAAAISQILLVRRRRPISRIGKAAHSRQC